MKGRRLLYADEAAEIIGVSAATIRSWVFRGHLKRTATDRARRPLYLDTDVYLAERATRQGDRIDRRTPQAQHHTP